MIGSIVPWFGSKRTLAPRVVAELGLHRCYWEPFCGSMAVLLGKKAVTYETANDLHGDLVNLARVLQDEKKAKRLYARTSRTLFAEDFCREAKERIAGPCEPAGDVERAYWYFVFSWFHLNGIAGTRLNRTGNMCVRYSSRGGNGATRWRSVVESIPDWHQRLRGVQILNRDGLLILENIEDEKGTAIYADPPYLAEGDRYVHTFTPEQHRRLAELLCRFRHTRVVVSYYADPRLESLYPGWTVLDSTRLRVAKGMVNGAMRDDSGRVEAPEVLLLNGFPLQDAETPLALFGGEP